MLGIQLNPESSEPLYLQLFNALRDAIQEGSLSPNERLPPTRALAGELGVSRSVAIAAYDLLASNRLVWARVGSGTYVRRSDGSPGGAAFEDPDQAPYPKIGAASSGMRSGKGAEGSLRWGRSATLERPAWIVFGLDPELLERTAS